MDSAEACAAPRLAMRAGWLDRTAIALSGLCAVHCVATSVAVLLLASVGGALLDPRIHETGLMLAMLLGSVALGAGLRAHGKRTPLMIGACGLMLMGIGLIVRDGLFESAITICGVTLLAYAHLRNRRAHRH